MVYLVCELTPPPKDSQISNLAPNDSLTSKEAMSQLKRKAHFTRLSSESLKKFRPEPAPQTEDSMIMKDHERVQLLLPDDRDKLHVCIPFENEIQTLRNEVNDLKALQKKRLMIFIANALIELARKIAKRYKAELLDDLSTTKLQQFIAKISETQLIEMAILSKLWPFLRKLDKVYRVLYSVNIY